MAKVLVACEFSGIVREAFARQGHDAWSCDILDTEIPGQHYQQNIRDVLFFGYKSWDLVIAHPPCTYLTNAGVRHLHSVPSVNGKLPKVHGVERWQAMYDGAEFFRMFFGAAPMVAIENPIPHKYAVQAIGRKYDQLIQPWQFGHGETKAICLWLQNLPKLVPTDIVEGREQRIWRMSPGEDRARERSRFFTGIADAMATQWGSLLP